MSDAAKLAALDDEQFTDYVFDHLADDVVWPTLLTPELVQRTRAAVGSLIADLRQVQQEKKADPGRTSLSRTVRVPAARRYYEWLANEYQPQLSLLAERSKAAKAVYSEVIAHRRAAEIKHERKAAGQLARAIQRHRLSLVSADAEPTSRDIELWAVLAEVLVPFGKELLSADEAFSRGRWTLGEVPA